MASYILHIGRHNVTVTDFTKEPWAGREAEADEPAKTIKVNEELC